MAENVDRQKDFVKKQFVDYEIKKTDNAQDKGITEEEKFPTDMLISNGKNDVALQFTELQSTLYYHTNRIKENRYTNKSMEEFLKIFKNDKLQFSWDDSISLFDENLCEYLLPYLVSNDIFIEDINVKPKTQEEWELELLLVDQINNSNSCEEIKQIFDSIIFKFDYIVLTIRNSRNVKLNFRIRESHFPNIPNAYATDFMPAYSSNIKSGLEKALDKKNVFKGNEKCKLEKYNITRENHYLICQLAEYVDKRELEELKKLKIQSDKYSKIIITYDNYDVCEISTIK